MSDKTASFWSSPWTIGVATSIIGSVLLELVSAFLQPILRVVELAGIAVLVLVGIVLVLGLLEQSAMLGAAFARSLGAGYGFMIGTYIGGFIQASVLPPLPPHPSISLFSPLIGGGVILWLAWGAPVVGALIGAANPPKI